MTISDKQRDEINNLGGGWPPDVKLGDLIQGDGNGPNGNVRYTGAGTDIDIYVEATGDDSADGSSPATAWATTERVVTDLGLGKFTDKAVTVHYGAGTFKAPRSDIRATGNIALVGVHWKGYRDPNQIYIPAGQTFAAKAGFVTVSEATVAGGFSPNSDGYSHFANLVLAGFDLASSVFPSTSPVVEVNSTYAALLDNMYPFTTFWDFGKSGAIGGFPGSAGAISNHTVTGIRFKAPTAADTITIQGLACYGCSSSLADANQVRAINCALNNSSFENLLVLAGTQVTRCRIETLSVFDTGLGNTLAASLVDGNTNAPVVTIKPGASITLTLGCDFRNPNASANSAAIQVEQGAYMEHTPAAPSTFDGCQRAVICEGGTFEVAPGSDMTGNVNGDGITLRDGGRALGVSGLSLTAAGSELIVGELAGQTFASVLAPGVSSPVLLCLATP